MLLKNLLKICWKGFTILCLITFVGMSLYLVFCGHNKVDANAFDKAMMFFLGVSLSGIITFSKAVYTTSKQTDFVKSILDLKKTKPTTPTPTEIKLEGVQDGKDNTDKAQN